jgi:hypothetical protein
MFRRLRTNPVFVRLTAHRRWPSLPVTILLYALLMLGLLILVAGELSQTLALNYSAPYILWTSLLTFLFSPAVFGIMTSFMTTHYARGDMLPLMIMSGLAADDIARGYVAAALYRLRVLWAIYLALPPVLCVVLGLNVAVAGQNTLSLDPGIALAMISLWIWPVLSAMILGFSLNLLAICTALNFVLNDRRQWYGIASSLLISGTWGVGGLASLAGACLGVPLIVAVAVLVMCLYSYNGAKNGVQRAVNRQIEVTT